MSTIIIITPGPRLPPPPPPPGGRTGEVIPNGKITRIESPDDMSAADLLRWAAAMLDGKQE